MKLLRNCPICNYQSRQLSYWGGYGYRVSDRVAGMQIDETIEMLEEMCEEVQRMGWREFLTNTFWNNAMHFRCIFNCIAMCLCPRLIAIEGFSSV
ncbi:hypothetical protein OAZ06_04060 [Synechococcus sp. AH-736-G20]|nr:hypothetical protein [Synechococcus sp. AH-736-G20]